MEQMKRKKNILATKIYKYFYDNFDKIEDTDGEKFASKLNYNEHKDFYNFLQKKYDLSIDPVNIDSYQTIYIKYFLEKLFLFEDYQIELISTSDIKKPSDHILKMSNDLYTIYFCHYVMYPNGYRPRYTIKILDNLTNKIINTTHSTNITDRMFYDSIYEKLVDMIQCAISDMF